MLIDFFFALRNAKLPVEMFAQSGKVGPAYCTGVGKAMLAISEPVSGDAVMNCEAMSRAS